MGIIKFWLLKLNLTSKVKVNRPLPPNNSSFKQCALHPWCKFGDPGLNELWRRQAENGANLDPQLETNSIPGTLTKVFCTSGPILMILA